MSAVLVYVLVWLVAGVHAQLGTTQCTFATQANCPNFLANSYCNIDNGVCECPTVAGYVDDGTGIACIYDCGNLTAPENGVVNAAAGTTTGDIAQIECNNGYQMNGSSISTCVADAGWNNTETVCEPEPPTTTQIPFIETTMFIGLIAGASGGCFALIFVFVYYVLSKHCCLERKKLHH